MDGLAIAILWLMLSVVAGAIAGSKNRCGFCYFILSIIFSPLVGLLLAFGVTEKKQ